MAYAPTTGVGLPGRYPVPAWQVQAASLARASGADVSQPGYPARSWYPAPPRSTVMAALLANGLYPGIEVGRAMEEVDRSQFSEPWWYRCEFDVSGEGRTAVRLEGVIPGADVWVNGHRVATVAQTRGAFSNTRWDISGLVKDGPNALALSVPPCDPQRELAISWIDWAQHPPDNNMGVWRDVVIERSGDIWLGPPSVTSDLPGVGHGEAAGAGPTRALLSVRLELSNLSTVEVEAQLRVLVSGPASRDGFMSVLSKAVPPQAVRLGPGERREVTLSAEEHPALVLDDPALWWPVGEGAQPLHSLRAEVFVDGLVSAQQTTRFGVRSVTSDIADGGGRRFYINGRLVPVFAGGWAPDLFLRHDPLRVAQELSYVVDMGLNALRLEGKLENDEFFEQADTLGVMVLPGWECCSWWEVEKRGDGPAWTDADFETAARQASSEAVRLRNHPSVICFLIGSDYAPTERAAEVYVRNFRDNGWQLPLVSSATAEGTEAAGPSGMKMTGPYSYVPPSYWYTTQRGGAIGFNSETGAGATVPLLSSLERMLSPGELEDLWREPEAKQYHAGPPSEFDNLAGFHRSLAARYGPPASLPDFVRKAQLANYETVRAQFEAYRSRALAARPATGVVYWMLNSPWPSLNWQLYDWYLSTPAAYFAAKKANRSLHAMYDYASAEVLLSNCGPGTAGPVQVSVELRSLAGEVLSSATYPVSEVPHRGAVPICPAPVPATNYGPAYFLVLQCGPEAADRNVYWLSCVTDEFLWEQSSFHTTPLSQTADLTDVAKLPAAAVQADISSGEAEAGYRTIRLSLHNQGDVPAVGLLATVTGRRGRPYGEVVQAWWDDNFVTLFPGEKAQLTARVAAADAEGLELDGFNVPRLTAALPA